MTRRTATRRRARAAAGWLFAAAAAAQVAFSVALESGLPELRDPEYGHKLRLLRARHGETPVLALGSSRTLAGLRPDALPPGAPAVFNFGLTAHGPLRQNLVLDRLLREGIRPRAVVLEVLPLALPNGVDEFDRVPAFRLDWGDVRFLRMRGERQMTADWLAARALPWYANRFAVVNQVMPAWLSGDQRQDQFRSLTERDGWLCAPPTSDAEAAANRARVTLTERPRMATFRIDPAADRALRASLARCRSEGIAAAVVVMPEASWYRAFLPPAGDAELRAYLAALGRDADVPTVDARDWCADADFWDGGHLAGDGATAFTRRFGREVLGRLK